ncbi:MAG: hypothetical protein J1F14_03960 [Treponema sp.]|nr:hypothetical protein [Treponema sp.]
MEELFAQIKGNADLANEFEAATDNGTIGAFLSAHGCSASEADFTSYIADHS